MPPLADTRTIAWADGAVRLIDQRRLPDEFVLLDARAVPELAEAIRTLAVRGAPALGAAGALGVALAAREAATAGAADWWERLTEAAEFLRATRPTAVNLGGGIDRALAAAAAHRADGPAAAAEAALAEALALCEEDVAANRALGRHGAALLPDGANVLTHCNTGSLATVHYGTALGVIRAAVEGGKRLHVWVDETRPLLQGARLTAWECRQLGIPHTVIADGAAGWLMRRGRVDAALVGADRIAANGDTANKIGTYTVAALAAAHGVPFYVAAPTSTVDLHLLDGERIPIEERDPAEVTHLAGRRVTPPETAACNPAFDVTPARLVAAIITERGIAQPPGEETLRPLCEARARDRS